jgi:transcriptional regulator with XRE-family HTH domain
MKNSKYYNEAFLVSRITDEIYRKRKEMGLSHQKLGDEAEIDRSTISLIESKKCIPSIFTLLKICKALGISLEELLRS